MTTTPEKKAVTGTQRSLVIGMDRIIYSLSRHWLAVFNIIVFIYVALPISAPILMKAGAEGPARVIYTVYSPMCHQMAQRSFFLFGEQTAYPREIAGTDLTPIESYIGGIPEFEGVTAENWPAFFGAARAFRGNEQMGYKMALCERDIGIYGFVLVGGLLYAMLRNRVNIKALPILVFVIVGLGPIALDGFSQLFSYWGVAPDGSAPTGIAAAVANVLPVRESTPTMRSLTGALFGLMLVWLAYPQVNAGMKGTENNLGEKLRKAGVIEGEEPQREAQSVKRD
jgi:uncharacterized membrane protein